MTGPEEYDQDATADADIPSSRPERVRAYYRALDTHDYDLLQPLLHPSFVHDRPELTLDGRERFVAFMREERPRTDTRHLLAALYAHPDGLAAQGRLVADETVLFRFVDVFSFEGAAIARIRTYTDR